MCKNLIKTIVAVNFFIIFIITSFAASHSTHNIKEGSLSLFSKNNDVYEITGCTNSNSIQMNMCKNMSLIFKNCSINLYNNPSLSFYNSSCELVFEGENVIESNKCITLRKAELLFKSGNVLFNGDVFIDPKTKLSIGEDASFSIVSKNIGLLNIMQQNLKTGYGLSSLLCIELSRDSVYNTPLSVEFKNVSTGEVKKITLPPYTLTFAVNLPDGKYSINISDESGVELSTSIGEVRVSGVTKLKNVNLIKPKALSIDKAEIEMPSKYGASDGKIIVHVSGGSGSYIYSLNNKTQQKSAFTKLTAGLYTLVVEDSSTHCKIKKDITIIEPFSNEIDILCLNGKVISNLSPTTAVLYETTVPYGTKTAQLSCELIDSRATYSSKEALDIIPLSCGINSIPISVSVGNLSTTYSVIIKRMPPPLTSNVDADIWYPYFNVKFLPKEDGCTTAYNINNSQFELGSQVLIQKSGIYSIQAYAEKDGVKSDKSIFQLKIDSEVPTITSTSIKKNASNHFECKVSAVDLHSGLDYITYTTKNKEKKTVKFVDGAATFTLEDNYSGSIFITATDNCGNTSKEYEIKDVICDNENPKINKVTPSEKSTMDTLILPKLEFSEEIALGNGNIFISENNGDFKKLDKSLLKINGKTVIFNIPLNYETRYKIIIEPDAFCDKSGNFLDPENPYQWEFTTPVSPNNSHLIYLNLSASNIDFSPYKQYYIAEIIDNEDIYLNAITKNSQSKLAVSVYSHGKLIKKLTENSEQEFIIDKNILKYHNKRIIIDVTSQNSFNTKSYVVDLLCENDIPHIENNSEIKGLTCYGLNKSADITPSLALDKGAYFSLILKTIPKETLLPHVVNEVENQKPFASYFAVEIKVNRVVNNLPTELDEFSPVTVVMNLKPSQKILKVNNNLALRRLLNKSFGILTPIADMDLNPNTATFQITRSERFIIIETNSQMQSNNNRSKKSSNHNPIKAKEDIFVLCAGESITADKLNFLMEKNIPLILRINGKDVKINTENIPINSYKKELTYKDILSGFCIGAKTYNPPTGIK